MMTIVSYLKLWRSLLTMRAVWDWTKITMIDETETMRYVVVRSGLFDDHVDTEDLM